jgi:hypothetical protein
LPNHPLLLTLNNKEYEFKDNSIFNIRNNKTNMAYMLSNIPNLMNKLNNPNELIILLNQTKNIKL